ncbi:helix-turn-helix transcriptional regulator [Vagococcus fluvialis]|nr:helix-turn-helix transcriptional regulator [Vagococcus fluvialis]NKD51226.1 helix-turn-helix transcriptional regulator [Vagococcus fluvialis]
MKILVSKKTISNWETGKTTPDLESLLRLSDLFNLSLDELIKGDKEIMEKIKKDTDTVTSNKKIALIIMSWTIIYGLILLTELF